jgi:recombinational DNA repair ATPase RecF
MIEKLKIIGIKVDNLRKLSAVEMEFAEKGLIQFRGKNGQGKTSILDSFEILLRGNKCVEKDMIQHGKGKAEIIGTIGEYEIKRVITEKSNRIEVKNKDGLKVGKPQEFLDTLINELTFNPRPFLNQSPEQKLRFMMKFLKIDFTQINSDIDEAEQDRLLTGRIVKKYGELKPVAKVERVSISDLISRKNEIIATNDSRKAEYDTEKEAKIKAIREFNEEQALRHRNINDERVAMDMLYKRMSELKDDIKAVEKDIEASQKREAELPKDLPEKSYEVEIEVPVMEATDSIDEEIELAEITNIDADIYLNYCNQKKEKAGEQAKYEKFTMVIDKLREEKKKILSAVKMPVEGLEIREEGLYHNDIFSENWSEAEGLRISSELCLSMGPKLPAIFIDDGETYDADGLKSLEQWALKNDLQAFISIVDSTEGTSESDTFYIEEGELV